MIKGSMSELRPCTIDGKDKALFHCWEQWANVIGEPYLAGGHFAGQISQVFAIVEFENHTVGRLDPGRITFDDSDYYKKAKND